MSRPAPAGPASSPCYDADLFAPEALREPFEHCQAIRELAPVVWLSATYAYALARFDDVQAAMQAPEILISGKGVGFNSAVNELADAVEGERTGAYMASNG